MRSPLARYVKLKLPSAPGSNIQRIADAARAASAELGTHSPFKIIDLLGSAFRWFSFEEGAVYTAGTASKYRDAISAVFCYKSGAKANLTPGSAQAVRLYSDGANFTTQASFDFDASFLVNKNFSIITYVRPITAFIDTNLPIYFPLHILGGDFRLGYSATDGLFARINNNTVSGTGNTIQDRDTLSVSRFASITISAQTVIEENEQIVYSGTAQQISSYSNGKIGAVSLNTNSWYGSIADVFIAPPLSASDRSAIRKFLYFYKGLDSTATLALKGFRSYSFPFGNSFSDNVGIQTGVLSCSAIAVDSGTVYGNTIYDESGKKCFIVDNTGKFTGTKGVSAGGLAIAYDANYIYALNLNHTGGYDLNGNSKFTVRKFTKDINSPSFVPFSGTLNEILVSEVTGYYFNNLLQAPTGIAVSATEIFVSDFANNKVKVYSIADGTPVREFTVNNPGKLTFMAPYLYAVQKLTSTTGQILELTTTGTVNRTITLISNPVSVGVFGGRLIVCDNGSDKQIKVVDVTSTPTIFRVFGNQGGASGTARVAKDRGRISDLYFLNLVDAQVSATDLIVVDGNGGYGCIIQSYNIASEKKNWEIKGTLFLESGGADPDNPALIYTSAHLFQIDHHNRSWIHKACTLNTERFPNDDRLNSGEVNARIFKVGTRKFLVTIRNNTKLSVFRFDPANEGFLAIPCFWIRFDTFQYWSDANGDGQENAGEIQTFTLTGAPPSSGYPCSFDDQGNIWHGRSDPFDMGESKHRIFKIPLTEINASGVPVYNFGQIQTFEIESLRTLQRLSFYEGKLWAAGISKEAFASIGYDGASMGDKIVGYTIGTNLELLTSLKVTYSSVPYREAKDFYVLGERIFVGYIINSAFYDPRQQLIEVYKLGSNTLIARFNYTPLALDGNFTWFDFTHPFSVTSIPEEPNKFVIVGEDVAYNRNQIIVCEFARPKLNNYPLVSDDLGLWLEADRATTLDTSESTTTVSSWGDRSAKDTIVTQTTKASQFELVPNALNGLPVLRASTPRRMNIPSLSFPNGLTLVALVKYQPVPSGYWTLLTKTSGSGAAPFDMYAVNGNGRLGFAAIATQTTALDSTKYQIVSLTHDKSVARYYLNGVADGTANGGWANDTGTVILGSRGDDLSQFVGDIAALIVYSSRNDKGRVLAENYLRQKYAIA